MEDNAMQFGRRRFVPPQAFANALQIQCQAKQGRDGTVCVSSLIPPSCPLPEPHDDVPNPATVLANSISHPLNSDSYMPILCTSSSAETRTSNGGDGSTWCVYPDGDQDIFIADIYDCIVHPQIKSEVFPEYHSSIDGICCPSRAFTCAQPMEAGEEPSVPRWWYNSATGTCQQFMWDPNTIEGASPNNFKTVEHCESYCRDTCTRGSREFAQSTSAIYNEVPKMGCMSTRATCSSNNECVLIGSTQTCCAKKEFICSPFGGRIYLEKPKANFDRGVSTAGSRTSMRYYYDIEKGKCINFVYHGLGNFNNFQTKQECCEAGEVVIKEPGTSQPLYCDSEVHNSCPGSSQCRHHSLLTKSVCCGSPPSALNICPKDERPYMETDDTVRECAVNIPGSCPSHFLCRFNSKMNKYYCCAPAVEGVCKDNAKYLVDDGTKMPRICTPGLLSACPAGYSCQLRMPFSTSGYCCQLSSNVVMEGCPPGEYALTKAKKIVECDPFNGSSCPSSFSCQFAVAFQRYQCCGNQPPEEQQKVEREYGCPSSQVAFLDRDKPMLCTSSGSNCPFGYFCQFSNKNKQFQCCGHKAGCPKESVAFLDLSGIPMACSLKANLCPTGYICQLTEKGNYICCTGKATEIESTSEQPKPDENMVVPASSTPKIPTVTGKLNETTNTVLVLLCPPDTVLTNGECRPRGSIGASCLMNSQCYNGTICINRLCAVQSPRVVHQVNKQNEKEKVNKNKLRTAKLGEPCEDGTRCPASAKCRLGRCMCDGKTVMYRDRCMANLCGQQQEPALNSDHMVMECIGGTKCPRDSSCAYSFLVTTYLCCKHSQKKPSNQWTIQFGATEQRLLPEQPPQPGKRLPTKCPDGQQPMLFPSTQQPLLCDLLRGCPNGFLCTARMCCPRTEQTRSAIFLDPKISMNFTFAY
ncbi:unnamed protein product [Cylicocyclus nassatus]|uniref:BPTI/Kunitz inhibitor domain-containing protein n=1 Tax=Cylicocyclus nassatus TaxID=53992 RepID=A0AA36GSR9_CYLNA|nr:unnamed protein product [Cylicocyclus nassatus]